MATVSNNKRIAKNTLFLYIRMLFVMGVTLYTSRVVLQTLGIEDFGIYNVVGGIVTMFTFLNGGMVSATQRYLTFEIGRNNFPKLQSVFSTAIQIHAIISIIILLLAETVGLWFLFNKMIIPDGRLYAAFWVYQCSIVACIIKIMSVPYNADIIAHEKMSAFAYISVLEVVLNLAIVIVLPYVRMDQLILYAVLILLIQVIIRLAYLRYCNRNFDESHYNHHIRVSLLKEMIAFAGWSFWGNLACVLYSQGLNLMLNVFFGPAVNAARGVAVQVQSAVQQFVTNFQMALNPQITKNFAIGELKSMHVLMFRSARFSFYLLYFLTLPVLLETNFLLSLWLGDVPENTVVFTQIMILISLIYTTANPCAVANQATGKVKKYQAVVGGILLTILPISYWVLSLGAPVYSVFIVHFCVECVAQLFRIIILRNLINIRISDFFRNVYFKISLTAIIATFLPLYAHCQFDEGWMRFFVVGVISVLSVGCSVFIFGLSKNERTFILRKIFK